MGNEIEKLANDRTIGAFIGDSVIAYSKRSRLWRRSCSSIHNKWGNSNTSRRWRKQQVCGFDKEPWRCNWNNTNNDEVKEECVEDTKPEAPIVSDGNETTDSETDSPAKTDEDTDNKSDSKTDKQEDKTADKKDFEVKEDSKGNKEDKKETKSLPKTGSANEVLTIALAALASLESIL